MKMPFTLTIRLAVTLAFVVSMPVLAIPQVNEHFDRFVFGKRVPAVVAKGFRDLTLGDAGELSMAVESVNDWNHAAGQRSSLVSAAKTAGDTATDREKAIVRSAPARSLTPAEEGISNEEFNQLQSRLQRLGVEYFVLEKFPEKELVYRFHCLVAVPGSAAYSRPFEAHDSKPLRAMQRVLSDVESWCASHSTTTSTKIR